MRIGGGDLVQQVYLDDPLWVYWKSVSSERMGRFFFAFMDLMGHIRIFQIDAMIARIKKTWLGS